MANILVGRILGQNSRMEHPKHPTSCTSLAILIPTTQIPRVVKSFCNHQATQRLVDQELSHYFLESQMEVLSQGLQHYLTQGIVLGDFDWIGSLNQLRIGDQSHSWMMELIAIHHLPLSQGLCRDSSQE